MNANGRSVTVETDHIVQEFKVVVRSSAGVHPNTVKDFLQRRWEVLKIEEVDNKVFGIEFHSS